MSTRGVRGRFPRVKHDLEGYGRRRQSCQHNVGFRNGITDILMGGGAELDQRGGRRRMARPDMHIEV